MNVPTVKAAFPMAPAWNAASPPVSTAINPALESVQADFLTATRVRRSRVIPLPAAVVEDGVTLALHLPLGSDERAGMMAQIEMRWTSPPLKPPPASSSTAAPAR